jgi:hypothetical protein
MLDIQVQQAFLNKPATCTAVSEYVVAISVCFGITPGLEFSPHLFMGYLVAGEEYEIPFSGLL